MNHNYRAQRSETYIILFGLRLEYLGPSMTPPAALMLVITYDSLKSRIELSNDCRDWFSANLAA